MDLRSSGQPAAAGAMTPVGNPARPCGTGCQPVLENLLRAHTRQSQPNQFNVELQPLVSSAPAPPTSRLHNPLNRPRYPALN